MTHTPQLCTYCLPAVGSSVFGELYGQSAKCAAKAHFAGIESMSRVESLSLNAVYKGPRAHR